MSAPRRHVAAAILAVAIGSAAGLPVPSATAATALPSPIEGGPTGRVLLEGWKFRPDPLAVGESAGWSDGSADGWKPVQVPHAFNDPKLTATDFLGSVGWYRTTFDSAAAVGVVRFQGIGGSARVWLNGKRVASRSAMYGVPLELQLSPLHPTGNTLVVRVDGRPEVDSLPTVVSPDTPMVPHAGWWNWEGLLRQVDLRPAGEADLRRVTVTSTSSCAAPGCPFTVDVSADVVNTTDRPITTSVGGTFGDAQATLGTRTVAARSTAGFTTRLTVAADHAWSPSHPNLIRLSLTASAPGAVGSSWVEMTGVRDVRVTNGVLKLNGKPIRVFGVSLHEDSAAHGGALDEGDIETLWSEVRASRANVIRSHYPLAPQLIERADRNGVLVWDELPFWQEPAASIALPKVRSAAQAALMSMISRDISHPSVITWSLGNELFDVPATGSWVASAAAAARAADPSRPLSIALKFSTRPSAIWNPLDLIGVNIYTGWYGQGGKASNIGPSLERVRFARSGQALVASEFGAEAGRLAPTLDRGGEVFQSTYLQDALRSLAAGRNSGAIMWLLRDFACRPGWFGGNDWRYAAPPFNQKGILRRDGSPKFGWAPLTGMIGRLTGKPELPVS